MTISKQQRIAAIANALLQANKASDTWDYAKVAVDADPLTAYVEKLQRERDKLNNAVNECHREIDTALAENGRLAALLKECEPLLYHPHEPEMVRALEKRIAEAIGNHKPRSGVEDRRKNYSWIFGGEQDENGRIRPETVFDANRRTGKADRRKP